MDAAIQRGVKMRKALEQWHKVLGPPLVKEGEFPTLLTSAPSSISFTTVKVQTLSGPDMTNETGTNNDKDTLPLFTASPQSLKELKILYKIRGGGET